MKHVGLKTNPTDLVTRDDLRALSLGTPAAISGMWLSQVPFGPLTNNTAVGVGVLRLSPFRPPVAFTADQIAVVTAGTTAGGTNAARLLIYGADAAGWPDALLRRADVTGLSTAGGKSAVLSSPIAFAPGEIYWVGLHSDAANTLRLISSQSAHHLGYSSAADIGTRVCVNRTLAFTSLPPNPFGFVSADLNGSAPAEIRFRVQ